MIGVSRAKFEIMEPKVRPNTAEARAQFLARLPCEGPKTARQDAEHADATRRAKKAVQQRNRRARRRAKDKTMIASLTAESRRYFRLAIAAEVDLEVQEQATEEASQAVSQARATIDDLQQANDALRSELGQANSLLARICSSTSLEAQRSLACPELEQHPQPKPPQRPLEQLSLLTEANGKRKTTRTTPLKGLHAQLDNGRESARSRIVVPIEKENRV